MAAYQDDFFTRGPSPLARVTFFSLAAIVVMIADHRFAALGAVRTVVSTVITPIEQALAWPGRATHAVVRYFGDQSRLLDDNRLLNARVLELSADGQRARLLAAESGQIAAIKEANARFSNEGVVAEIIRDARNPFARRIVLNRGFSHGVAAGAVAIDGKGVVGQVTAVGAMSSEVTLITEKEQAVPVMVVRGREPAGLRAIAVGTGRDGAIELPFIPNAADIQVGDQLVTSGIDGTYPAGLAVATVRVVDKNPALAFARIVAQPVTAPDHYRFVKILARPDVKAGAYPKPDVSVAEGSRKAQERERAGRRSAKDRDR